MTVAGWKIWYTDDRRYSSQEVDWEDLPRDGVLYLTVYYDEWTGANENVRYTQNYSGDDWYFHRPGTDLFGSNTDSLGENWLRYPDCIFKRGQWATKSELDRVREEVQETAFETATD